METNNNLKNVFKKIPAFLLLVYSKLGNYNFMPGFALRTGYMMNETGGLNIGNKGAGGFSAGVGLYFLNTGLDYSMSPFGEMGNVQKLSVKKKF
ncbi:MAG: hypothetical protein KKH28_08615 [Elusimicrobia bacterium]|nr:hypothetical protein [Elusimicrobiota bacterium]